MSNVNMQELTGKPHKFFTKDLYGNDKELRYFVEVVWDMLKTKTDGLTIDAMEYRHDNAQKMQEFQWSYNFFNFYHEKMHDVLIAIKDLTIEACNYYNIDFEKEKYYLTSWLNYTRGPNIFDINNIKLDDHGSHPKEFHGYYAINAEPGETFYKLDNGELFPHKNKNGKILLSLNGYHHGVGSWPFKDPRITIAYNIMPLSRVPRDHKKHASHIPLL
jgi:hypothetical protein